MAISVTHFTDPGCPWAYSASPALAALAWRYGDQLDWRLVLIGLTETSEQYLRRGYTPLGAARGQRRFRRWGMPLAAEVKPRVAATSRACRALVAVRRQAPDRLDQALRALQFLQFTTSGVLDDEDDLRGALATVEGLDADAVIAALADPEVTAEYEADRRLARSAEGSPTEFQGKAARTDGPVRYTAPSLVFERGPRSMAGEVPAMLSRAALFRFPGMGAWAYVLLGAVLLIAGPLLLIRAVAAASGEDPR